MADDIAYGGYTIYGKPDLEGGSFRFWLNPDPYLKQLGPLCVFAYENNCYGCGRHTFVTTGEMEGVLDNIKRWYHIGSITFPMNRRRVTGRWNPRLRFQSIGYVDLYEA